MSNLQALKKQCLIKIDTAVYDLQAILKNIETIECLGWEARKHCAIAASYLQQIQYLTKKKKALETENREFLSRDDAIKKCFSIIEQEIGQIEKLLTRTI